MELPPPERKEKCRCLEKTYHKGLSGRTMDRPCIMEYENEEP